MTDTPPPGDAPGDPRHAGKGLRVMVVEDDAGVATMLMEALAAEGHAAAVASGAAAAIQLCTEFRPAVVLLDIGLPEMDGYALAEQLRNVPAIGDLRIVAVTGHGDAADRRRSRTAGFDRHLVKPIDLEALMLILRALTEEPSHHAS